jgi:hypothetical protein
VIVRVLLAIEWMLATTVAVVAHLVVEIVGAALLGYALLYRHRVVDHIVRQSTSHQGRARSPDLGTVKGAARALVLG